MRVIEHQGWGHGLLPRTTHDMTCLACKGEKAAGTPPKITGEDDK